MVGSLFHDSHPLVIHDFFQPLVGCRLFQFHVQNQQAFGWKLRFFSKPGFIPQLAPPFSTGSCMTSHRVLLIPSSQLSRDSLVTKDEDLPSSDFLEVVLGWIWKGSVDTSQHD